MKKILMIVKNDFINDSRIIREANSLGKNGYEVLVLALYKNGLKKREDFDYFSVERIPLYTRDKLSNKIIYIQSIKYIEFYKKCIRQAQLFKPDIVHCHDMSTLPIGKKIQKMISCKFIYDSHELWSHSSGSSKYPSFLLNIKNKLERNIARNCDAIITVSNSIAEILKKYFDLTRKPTIIRNIPPVIEIVKKQNIFREKFNIERDKKIILYQGGVTKGRGIEKVIESMTLMPQNIVLVILGNGILIPKVKELATKMGVLSRVYFHEAVNSNILINYTNSADMGISLIENTCLSYYYSLPNKMFEFIQGEIPLICSNFPDMSNIIENYKVGEVVDPEDKHEIAKAISNILLDEEKYNIYKNNCRKAKHILNWENEEKVLLDLYSKL